MNREQLRQKALDIINETKKIIHAHINGEIECDEHVKEAYRQHNAAMRTRYYTSDVPIEQKRAYHRKLIARMRNKGLHRMLSESKN